MPLKPFHPDDTKTISKDAMAAWIQTPITGDLQQLPGLGPIYATTFKAAGITTTHQLSLSTYLLKVKVLDLSN